ncbi:plasminogen receptor (KT) [Ahaetulla prasina]|uniref:plasminogen receptor (KT) n=1 Tax=Ahaetulla prasina TaxID=499056 RepID=UPI00264997AF|nr:plasminogen receptor (KT) [Ahaetulla prasina]XP_058027867.1 plasminogen receptor (KT) [Ahaetulla prasina]XP_058027868.1 plasminogen receptor (KT) [Ahaetulla prasina]XP_058027869.1 plasminogen receptor (KT) [Ahaetulla prasina]
MGFIFSKSVNESLQNQKEFMLMNSRLQLERQLLMQNQMRERQMAMQIAGTREFLKYFGTFYGLTTVGLTIGAIKNKKPQLFIPLIPLGFILAYQYDKGYGTLLQRMKCEAENIIDTDSAVLEMPKGPITFDDLEKARRAQSKIFIEK